MRRDEVLAIIQDERLGHYVWFEDNRHADAVVIQRDGHEWVVFVTDERGGLAGERRFGDEESAPDNFIKRLRLMKKSSTMRIGGRGRRPSASDGSGKVAAVLSKL